MPFPYDWPIVWDHTGDLQVSKIDMLVSKFGNIKIHKIKSSLIQIINNLHDLEGVNKIFKARDILAVNIKRRIKISNTLTTYIKILTFKLNSIGTILKSKIILLTAKNMGLSKTFKVYIIKVIQLFKLHGKQLFTRLILLPTKDNILKISRILKSIIKYNEPLYEFVWFELVFHYDRVIDVIIKLYSNKSGLIHLTQKISNSYILTSIKAKHMINTLLALEIFDTLNERYIITVKLISNIIKVIFNRKKIIGISKQYDLYQSLNITYSKLVNSYRIENLYLILKNVQNRLFKLYSSFMIRLIFITKLPTDIEKWFEEFSIRFRLLSKNLRISKITKRFILTTRFIVKRTAYTFEFVIRKLQSTFTGL